MGNSETGGSVCVFAGTADCKDDFLTFAQSIGRLIGNKRLRLVYGGGSTGLMGAVATAALDAGGQVIGVIPRCMSKRDDTLNNVSQLIVASTMHERKQKMHDLSDVFLALPGGLGTLEETMEFLCWLNLGIHRKSLLLGNVGNYWDPLLSLIKHGIDHGFVNSNILDLIITANTPSDAFAEIERCFASLNEKSAKDVNLESNAISDVMSEIYNHSSSYVCAFEMQKLAAGKGFVWQDALDAINKVREELQELYEEVSGDSSEKSKILEEYGDLLFAVIHLAQHLGTACDDALDSANLKFRRRFAKMEQLVEKAGLSIDEISLDSLLHFWRVAKQAILFATG